MTDFETHYESPPENWDATVRRLNGCIYQTTGWAEYENKRRGIRPIYLLARDRRGSEIAGSLALFQQSSRPLLSGIFRTLRLPAHPFFGKQVGVTEVARFIGSCEALAQKLGCHSLTIESFLSGQSPLIPGELGYSETQRLEFLRDLNPGLDELWKGLKKDHRERIRRLKREGVQVEVARGRADLEALRIVRETTKTRRGEKGQAYEIEHSEGLYDRLYEELLDRDLARLFIAKQGQELLGSICFLTFNGRANSIFSGSTAAGYKMGVQTLLFWSAVELFKTEGFQELNRGGVPASAAEEGDPLHGIYRFKSRLCTLPSLCRSGEKILRPLRYHLSRWREIFRH